MATLEMVRLRSMYPNTGRMTVRYAVPRFGSVDLDVALREVLTEGTETNEAITTPQVDGTDPVPAETPAGKGRTAR